MQITSSIHNDLCPNCGAPMMDGECTVCGAGMDMDNGFGNSEHFDYDDDDDDFDDDDEEENEGSVDNDSYMDEDNMI